MNEWQRMNAYWFLVKVTGDEDGGTHHVSPVFLPVKVYLFRISSSELECEFASESKDTRPSCCGWAAAVQLTFTA